MILDRRSILKAGVCATAIAINNKALAQGGILLGGAGNVSVPVLLPSATIADFAVKGSASAYVSLGNMSLPAGDWCIGVTAAIPSTDHVDYFLLSLGAQSDTILTNNGNLVIGRPLTTGNPKIDYGWTAVGLDDSGGELSPNQVYWFASSQQYGVMGPQDYQSGVMNTVARTIFIQKSGNTVSVWQVDPNCCAIQYNMITTTFGAIAAKPAFLGCLGKAALSGFSSIAYQRFFRTAQALTQYQMEAIASGVDPRAVVNFSSGNGDLLFAFNVAASNGQTYTDLIQGQTATANGTFATATALLPTTVDQNQIRFDLDRYRVFQNAGSVTNLPLSGNVYGADGTIQVAVTNTGGTIQYAYASLGQSKNGKFSGVFSGVATGLVDFCVEAKKIIGGSQVGNVYFASQNTFSTGPVLEWMGQSLCVQMRSNNSYAINSGALNSNARYQNTPYDSGVMPNYGPGNFKLLSPGYGEGRLTQIVGNALNYQFMQMNDALSGSSLLSNWLADTNTLNTISPIGVLTNALNNIQRFKPKYIIWHQGENSLGATQAAYYSQLTQLYNAISAVVTWTWYFIIIPVDNNFTSTSNYDQQMQAVRSAQINWANDMITAGKNVVLGCTVNDILKANTSGDGIHKLAVAGGYGVYAERVAQTILQLEGNQTYSGLGPRIVSAYWNGGTGITVTLTQNGGTGLQTNGGGAPTGFTASLSTVAGTQVPLLLGTPLTISATSITDATHVQLTLSATPASNPYFWYQYGCPALGTTDAAEGINNALYDNRTPAINTTLGYPVQPMTAPMLTTGP